MIDSLDKFQRYIAVMNTELEDNLAAIAKHGAGVDEDLKRRRAETEIAISDLSTFSKSVARLKELNESDDVTFDNEF